MLVKHSAIAVAPILIEEEKDSEDTEDYDQGAGDNVAGPSPPKQQKMEEYQLSYTIEEKKPAQNSYAYDFQEQVVSQCLTNAFAQKSSLNGDNLIPSIGCTMDGMIIFLYDPYQDILLRMFYKLKLYLKESNNRMFYLESIIELWIILNLYIFKPVMQKNLEDKVKCGFKSILKNTGVLQAYENLRVVNGGSRGKRNALRTAEDFLTERTVDWDGLYDE